MSLFRRYQDSVPSEESHGSEPAPSGVQDGALPFDRIGDILRREREARGDEVQWVADYLCIKRAYLEALENNEYEKLPADTYVIGFLRAYANYLGYEPQDVIDRYRTEMAGQCKKPALSMPSADVEARTPSGAILIGAAMAALVIYALWYNFSASRHAAATSPRTSMAVLAPPPSAPTASPEPTPLPVVETFPVAPVPVVRPPLATPTSVPAPLSVKPKPVGPVHFTLRAEQTSWILLTDKKGRSLYDRVLKPGESYKVPDAEGVTLTTSNPSGLIISADGVDLPKISTSGHTSVRSVALTVEGLKAKP